MKTLIFALIGVLCGIQATPPNPENLQIFYVFEIVRHGARSPILDDELRFNIVPDAGILTPQGMRQRFLLGKYNQKTYGESFGDEELLRKQGGLQVQSTDVNRTIQSGYSELFGMIDETNDNMIPNMTQNQFENLFNETRGTVQFKTRNAKDVKTSLGQNSIVNGFINIPIYLYKDDVWEDDLGVGTSCSYQHQVNEHRTHNNAVYGEKNLKIQANMSEAFAIEFNTTFETLRDLPFDEFALLGDVVFAEMFEYISQQIKWEPYQLENIYDMLNAILLVPFNDKARQIMVTRQLQKPLYEMGQYNKYIGEGRLGDLSDLATYRLYSAHDTNIANIMQVIAPQVEIDYIRYASNIYLELWFDDGAAHGKHFRVKTMYNGVALIFDECADGAYCLYEEFMDHMNSVLYQGDLKDACAENYGNIQSQLETIQQQFMQ